MMNNTESRSEIFRSVLDADNIQIITHKNPDGDTLGSSFALLHVLKKMGKNAEVICSDKVSKRMRFISDGIEELLPTFDPDFVVSVDVASPNLIGDSLADYRTRVDVAIDHHYSNSSFAKKTILSAEASSAGELMFELFEEAGIDFDDYIAEKLYTAISFDTGCFKFSNVTPKTHRIAAQLLNFSFDHSRINTKLFDTASLAQLRIENEAVSSVRQYKNNKITIATVTSEQIARLGVDETEIDGLTAITRRVEGTIVGITVRQKSDGEIKISLRSNENFDVSKIAVKFGGGGHIRAAACVMRCPVEEAEKRILEATFEEWDKQNGDGIPC